VKVSLSCIKEVSNAGKIGGYLKYTVMKKIIKVGFVFAFLMSAFCAMAALHGPSSDPGDPEFGGSLDCVKGKNWVCMGTEGCHSGVGSCATE